MRSCVIGSLVEVDLEVAVLESRVLPPMVKHVHKTEPPLPRVHTAMEAAPDNRQRRLPRDPGQEALTRWVMVAQPERAAHVMACPRRLAPREAAGAVSPHRRETLRRSLIIGLVSSQCHIQRGPYPRQHPEQSHVAIKYFRLQPKCIIN